VTSTLSEETFARIHGRLLCERRHGGWVELRARAMLAYVDIEPWMRRCGEGVRRVLASRLRAARRELLTVVESSPSPVALGLAETLADENAAAHVRALLAQAGGA
jgi:hypothetical protein